MKTYKQNDWQRRALFRLLSMSIILTVFNGVALGILVAWEEFGLPAMGGFRKKMLLALTVTIFMWIIVAVVASYFLVRSRKSRWGLGSAGGGMEKCEFCQRSLNTAEPPRLIKDHIVCSECDAKIEKEKKQVGDESSPE